MDYGDWRFQLPDLNQTIQMIEAEAQNSLPPQIDMSNMDLEYWKKTWEGALTAPNIHIIDNQPWGPSVQGWTSCNKQDRTCAIMIDRKADRDHVEPHEKMHAAGWDHPGFLQHLPGYLKPIK